MELKMKMFLFWRGQFLTEIRHAYFRCEALTNDTRMSYICITGEPTMICSFKRT